MITTNYALPRTRQNLSQQQVQKQHVTAPSRLQSQGSSLLIPNFTYNQLLVNKKNISFTGAPVSPVHLEILEKKVASVVKTMAESDLLIFGDSLKKAQNSVGDFVFPLIEKVHFIKDKSIKGVFLAQKLGTELSMQNLTDSKVVLNNKLAVPKNVDFVVTDKIKMNIDNNFIMLDPKAVATAEDLAKDASDDVKTFDLSNIVKNEEFKLIGAANKQRFNELVQQVEPEIPKSPKALSFDDIGGLDDVKNTLIEDIVLPIKYPNYFKNKKGQRGVLLYGPPGTGKSLFGQAIANEVKANYYYVKGSEFDDKFIGETEKRWRELYEEAKNNQPAIIFIDEAEGVLGKRSDAENARFDNKTVQQLLAINSDIEKNQDLVFTIAATNRFDMLDDAVTRPGRFGRHIEVPNPDEKGCLAILNVHTKDKSVSSDFNNAEFAKKLSDNKLSGADIDFIVQEADKNSTRETGVFELMKSGKYDDSVVPETAQIKPEHFEKALDERIAEKAKEQATSVDKPYTSSHAGFLGDLKKK